LIRCFFEGSAALFFPARNLWVKAAVCKSVRGGRFLLIRTSFEASKGPEGRIRIGGHKDRSPVGSEPDRFASLLGLTDRACVRQALAAEKTQKRMGIEGQTNQ
jgi:hypothetical protein